MCRLCSSDLAGPTACADVASSASRMPAGKLKTNLRAATNRFVGRTQELSRLEELFARGERAVTVFGPGGTGKTRLAEAFAQRAQAEFCASGAGGVWFCELASVRSLDGVCSALARALSIPPSATTSAGDAVARLGSAIAARGPIVVVFDNFEHLVDAAAEAVAVWLGAAPDLRVMATSQAQLHIEGEVRFELGPLELPGESVPGESGDIAQAPAVQLFVDRVQRLDNSFELSTGNQTAVATLVRRLEGIPLAIELAASRVELFGVQGLIDQLDQRLDMLARPQRAGPDRHCTLRTAIEWSWDLLNAQERRVLTHCAVFRGGFTAQAAAEVLAVPNTIDLVQSLRGKSLLRRYLPTSAATPRFSMYEAVRAFAAEQLSALAPEEQAALHGRHRDFFLTQSEAWANKVDGSQGASALSQLELEADNLLAIHERSLAQLESDDSAASTTVRCVLVLDSVTSVRGSLAPRLAVLDRTLANINETRISPNLFIRALRVRGKTQLLLGNNAAGLRDLDRAMGLADQHDMDALHGALLGDLGVHHHQRREMPTARVLYERALGHAEVANDRGLQGRIRGNLGALHHDVQRYEDARVCYHEALALLQDIGAVRLEAIHVANLGVLEQERGELALARGHFEAAKDLLEARGDRRLLALVVGNVGNLDHEEHNREAARSCHEQALSLLREVGDRRNESLCLGRLARANASMGWLDDARSCIAAADRLIGRYNDALVSAAIDVDRGFLAVAEARRAQAKGDVVEADRHLTGAKERIARALRASSGELSWAEQSDDIRTAIRILKAELDDLAQRDTTKFQRPALVVGPHGRWIQPPDGKAQDLRRRKALRLILVALIEQHRQSPGGGIPLEGLLAAGWPGERMVATAGANRVYVALTTLRKLGLRGFLLSQDDGYLLDPALPIERSEATLTE